MPQNIISFRFWAWHFFFQGFSLQNEIDDGLDDLVLVLLLIVLVAEWLVPHCAEVPLEVGHQEQRQEGERDQVQQGGLGGLENLDKKSVNRGVRTHKQTWAKRKPTEIAFTFLLRNMLLWWNSIKENLKCSKIKRLFNKCRIQAISSLAYWVHFHHHQYS